MSDRRNKRGLALGQRQFTLGAGMNHEADVGPHVMDDAVGLEDKVCAASEVGPKLIEHPRKIGLRSLIADGCSGQERAFGAGRKVAGGVRLIPWMCLFPNGRGVAVFVRGDLDGRPAELRKRGNQAADHSRLACAPRAAAYDNDGHLAPLLLAPQT